VLCYSWLLWVRFYPRHDMRTLFEGLETAFAFFGGVPREILFDQMRSVVVRDLALRRSLGAAGGHLSRADDHRVHLGRRIAHMHFAEYKRGQVYLRS
jgi:hypothetical protein